MQNAVIKHTKQMKRAIMVTGFVENLLLSAPNFAAMLATTSVYLA
jgi:hypothetical protein